MERGSEKQGLVAIGTPLSAYNENPVVSTLVVLDDGGSTGFGSAVGKNRTVYVAVFDTVQSEHHGFGLSVSDDGLHWSAGVDVALPGGCRTPLGLIDEGDGTVTMLFTRRSASLPTLIPCCVVYQRYHGSRV